MYFSVPKKKGALVSEETGKPKKKKHRAEGSDGEMGEEDRKAQKKKHQKEQPDAEG